MDDKQIDEEAVKVRRAYFKEWRLKNKEKIRRHNLNYWRKKAMQIKEGDGGEIANGKK